MHRCAIHTVVAKLYNGRSYKMLTVSWTSTRGKRWL